MKRELSYQKSMGLKGGPNHVEISITGYRADSPDRFRNQNLIPTGNISMVGVPHPVMGIDDLGNRQMMIPGQNYQFPGSQVMEFPIRAHGGQNSMDFGKMFKDMARQQSKMFGSKADAPQNMTTDNMIDYKKNSFTNKIAQNTFKALAMQEADNMANMMNQAMMPMAQFGMNVQSYDANRSNAGAYFDAYNTMKNRNQQDFNSFLGESGEMIQSIYNNPSEMKLKKVRTRITDPTVKDQYDQYSKDMKTGMTPTEPTDPWEAFNQNIQTMKEKKQPISMNDMGPIPMGFGYTPEGMVFMVGGPVPEFQPGGGFPQPSDVTPFGAIVPGVNPAYAGNYQYNFNRQPNIVPGLHTSDPQGGIGQSMYNSGFYDVYDGAGRQFWVQNPTQARQMVLDEQRRRDEASGSSKGQAPALVVPKKESGNTGGSRTGTGSGKGSESTEEIKTFTHEDVSSSGNAGITASGEGTTRRGNVTDEGSGSSSTTQNQVVNPQGGFFVTQPGYYGQQGVGYNLFPSNMRWQRGPGMNVGPAVAYNPMDTYLDEYDYKGRLFGKGPRRVKMSFSHYGKPGIPGMPNAGSENAINTQPPVDNRQQMLDIVGEGMKPSPDAKEVLGVDMSQSVFNPNNPNSVIWNSSNQPQLKQGGMFPAAAPYPGAYPFHAYTAFFQDGGENPVGTPATGNDPWAQTEAVWKRQMAGNAQDMADWGLAGMSMLSSFGEANERRDLEEQMKQRMFGDAVFNPYGAGDSSRGTWTTNRGDFRPDQHTPVQFQGWNQGMIGSPMTQYRQGGEYQTGGEYYLSDDEIQQIMAMGGQVEFLD